MDFYDEMYEYAAGISAISTHSHHNYHEAFENFTLANLLSVAYPGFGQRCESDADWRRYFENMSCRSDAYWLNQAIGRIYLQGEALSYENYRLADSRIRLAYSQDAYFHEKIITDICRIGVLILDEHRDPGDAHGISFVRPAMRLDWALAADARAEGLLGALPANFDDYLAAVRDLVELRVARNRVVTFKIASAYERPLDFAPATHGEAERAYGADRGRALADYMMSFACEMAVRLNLPIQFHTGLGQLNGTRAMNLLGLIRRYPGVRFVLLHGSFPWTSDAIALARTLPNVYLDLSWMYTLSTGSAQRFLSEALDAVPLDRIAWGCDTWTAEEGYGALLAVRQGLALEFARRIGEGLMTATAAKRAIDMLLRENAKALYQI